jgi:calpain-15
MIPEEVKPLLQTTKRIEGGQLFSGQEGSAMEVKQGNLGDCYFISSMGVVYGSVKENFGMGTREWSNPPGGYLVKFYKYGKEVYVMVDDRLPYSKEGELLFGKSEKGEKVLWPAILEKAYAKLNKGYANIAKGKMHIAMSEITGGYPTEIVLKEYADKIPILWAKLQ